MFVKITTSGPRQYVKLVESYRDPSGMPRQRVIATLGRIEAVRSGETDSLLNGLLGAAGKPSLEEGTGFRRRLSPVAAQPPPVRRRTPVAGDGVQPAV